MKDPVIFSELPTDSGHRIGVATLNVPQALNALNLEMVDLLLAQLTRWHTDSTIVAVMLTGEGSRAFCAGGDVRRLYHDICGSDKDAGIDAAKTFFAQEYRLDYLIHRFQKPIIVWGHGYVLGGGNGLLNGASHRVATPETRLAMPEVTIGLYPDVGATWFMQSVPGRLGLFLGLTGTQINVSDGLFAGWVDRCLPHDTQQAVIAQLQSLAWQDTEGDYLALRHNHGVVSDVLRGYEITEGLPESHLRQHYDVINKALDADTAAAVVNNLYALQSADGWLNKAVETLRKGSPFTAKLTFEQYYRGSKKSLEAVFQMELMMSVRCSTLPDFAEGVRALLVDKDGAPQWQYSTVADVPDKQVQSCFEPSWGDNHPLLDLSY